MAIKNMLIRGIRSFKDETNIEFAMPNGKKGSGLNIIVGSNNSGKSTIIESINIISSNDDYFSSDVRNKNTEETCKIYLEFDNGENYSMESIDNDGAFTKRKYNDGAHVNNILPILLLSTNRYFSHHFTSYIFSSIDYINNISNQKYRDNNTNKYSNFGGRMLEIFKNDHTREKYINEIKNIFPNIPNWNIDMYENELEIRFQMNNSPHNSNGAGQGLNNLFLIVDSYLNYDTNIAIVIDEPEISLHPDIQRNLFERLMEISKDKQIIITTHSPYLVDFSVLENGGKIFRVVKNNDYSNLYELNQSDYKIIANYNLDTNNPHILLLEARETLFFKDNIILVEGQDDVIAYKKILNEYNISNQISFFGWGVGGYKNFYRILEIMKKLGYKKVFCIADGDKKAKEEIKKLKKQYTDYRFYNIKADDIRDKRLNDNENKIIEKINIELKNKKISNRDLLKEIKNYMLKYTKNGLVNNIKECNIKQEYLSDVDNLVNQVKKYFNIIYVKKNEIKNAKNNYEINALNIGNNHSIDRDKLRYNLEEKFNVKILGGSGGAEVNKIDNDNYEYIEFYSLMNNNKFLELNNTIKINIKNNKISSRKINILRNELIDKEIEESFFEKCYK